MKKCRIVISVINSYIQMNVELRSKVNINEMK